MVHDNLGLIFLIIVTFSISYDDIFRKLIAEVWECSNIAKKRGREREEIRAIRQVQVSQTCLKEKTKTNLPKLSILNFHHSTVLSIVVLGTDIYFGCTDFGF